MKHRTYTLLLVLVNGLAQLHYAHAGEKPLVDESVVLSNVDGPDTATEAAKHLPAAQGPHGAASGTASAGVPSTTSAEVSMEQYKEMKLQQAATPNTGNPSTARRYLRVDKATMMEASGP